MKSSLVLQFEVDTHKHFFNRERKEWNRMESTSKLPVPNCALAFHLDAETEINGKVVSVDPIRCEQPHVRDLRISAPLRPPFGSCMYVRAYVYHAPIRRSPSNTSGRSRQSVPSMRSGRSARVRRPVRVVRVVR